MFSLVNAFLFCYPKTMKQTLLAIFIGGGLGALLRYGVTLLSKHLFHTALWGTLSVNLLGSFAMGACFGLLTAKGNDPSLLHTFITVGCLGALTTFSTFHLEVLVCLKQNNYLLGLSYLIGATILGLLLTSLGYLVTK